MAGQDMIPPLPPYGIGGKAAVVKLAQRSQEAQELMTVLSDENASRKDIKNADIMLAVLMYGGKNKEALSSLRFSRFMKMAASSSKLLPEKFPPTERAAVFHTWRVHLQVKHKFVLSLS